MGVPSNIGNMGVAIQAAKGTAAATAAVRHYVTASSLNPGREVAELAESTGRRVRSGLFVARVRPNGAVTFYIRPELAVPWLQGAMGSRVTTGAADPWTHTMSIASTQPWMTLWENIGDVFLSRYRDCKLSQLVIRSVAGEALTMEATVMGITLAQEDTALSSPTLLETEPYIHHDAEAALLVEGVAVASMRSAVITITTGATAIDGDALTGVDVAEGLVGISFDTEQLVADRLLWNRLHFGAADPADHALPHRGIVVLAGAPAGLSFKWSKRDNTGVAVAPERSLALAATNVAIESISGIAISPDGAPLVMTVRYRALDVLAGTALTAIVKNGNAAAVYAAS